MQIEGEEYYLETTTTDDDEDDPTTETEAIDGDDDAEGEDFVDENSYQAPPPVTNSKSNSGIDNNFT